LHKKLQAKFSKITSLNRRKTPKRPIKIRKMLKKKQKKAEPLKLKICQKITTYSPTRRYELLAVRIWRLA
jgi:hypothetical protein